MIDAMTDLDKLIEAVEGGEWPDDWREVTRALTLHPDERHIFAKRAFDGSLDAAKALHEALLPGYRWRITDLTHAQVWDSVHCVHGGYAEQPARAWLLAILKAYRSLQCDKS